MLCFQYAYKKEDCKYYLQISIFMSEFDLISKRKNKGSVVLIIMDGLDYRKESAYNVDTILNLNLL